MRQGGRGGLLKTFWIKLAFHRRCINPALIVCFLQVVGVLNGTDKLSGIIIKCPGVPDLYDYERNAHGASAGVPKGIATLMVAAQKFAKLTDGFIVPSTTCFEAVGVPYYREFYQKRGQEFFAVGLQAHELCWTDVAPVPPTNEVVRSFLDNAVTQHGPNSVLYISFGYAFPRLFFLPLTPRKVVFLPRRHPEVD